MNVRGERILIFGDSLSKHGSDSSPEVWDVNQSFMRSSSAPGDLLASLLAEQGAEAVRTNARVSRSAWNFWQRENADALITGDLAWKPSKVIVILGTNDADSGVDITKDMQSMTAIRDAYAQGDAEMWAIGPFISKIDPTKVELVAQMMAGVFGYRFIDGRVLTELAQHSGDGVHYTQAGARTLAMAMAKALVSRPSPSTIWKGVALGAAGLIGAIGVVALVRHARGRQSLLAGDTSDDDDFPQEGEDDEKWWERINRKAKERVEPMRKALAKHDAVIVTSGTRQVLLVKTPEMSNKDEGSIRITAFDEDGPIGHTTRDSLDKLAEEMHSDWGSKDLRPATEDEIIEWTGTERFAHGSEAVARVQRENAGLEGETKTVDVRKLFAWQPKLEETIVDVKEGRTSFSAGQPINVSKLDDPRGAFWILDGHHRVVEAINDGQTKVQVTVNDSVPRIERTGGAYKNVLANKISVLKTVKGLKGHENQAGDYFIKRVKRDGKTSHQLFQFFPDRGWEAITSFKSEKGALKYVASGKHPPRAVQPPPEFKGLSGKLEDEVTRIVDDRDAWPDLAEIRKRQPRPLHKFYGPNPTPEQIATHKAEMSTWNSEYRKASKLYKALVEESNSRLRSS